MKDKNNEEDFYSFDDSYRDSIATVDTSGKRIWMYPKKPSGTYHNRRALVTIFLLGIFFAAPFIKIDGHPFILLNFFERKFILFGNIFWPQDFFLLALTLISFFVFIILFTVVFGRLWCGWACPQTLFMEMVFRKIEYWIEGDANQQRKLDNGPWNGEKIRKKVLKQVIFVLISLLISHTVMAYLIGVDQTIEFVAQPPTQHLSGFIGLMFFTALFYWVFSYFREQACTVVCPYGRLQGVLLVKESIVVAYDWLRGEPRGKLKKSKVQEDKGDCIDCKLCVHVCPTGIDIRNGTQLECVNCTACIDVCDDVMEKIGKPKGLIRYASYNSIVNGIKNLFTPRAIAYSIVLVLLLGLTSFFVFTRSNIDASVKRVRGMTYQRTEDNQLSNLYNLILINKTFQDISIQVRIDGVEGASLKQVAGNEVLVPAEDLFEGIFIVKIPSEEVQSGTTEITFEFTMDGEIVDQVTTSFVGPLPGSIQ